MANRKTKVQKRRERFLFEEFATRAGIAAEIIEQREAPDLIVRVCETCVGVEVTEFFVSMENHGGTLQAQESIGDQIVANAQRLYQMSGSAPAHVSICFAPGRRLTRLDRDATSKLLADFVSSLNLSVWKRTDWRATFRGSPLPNEISFVHALGVPSFDMAHWGVARAGWVAPLTLTALQERVNVKATRFAGYREVVDKVWLVVVADGRRPSSLVKVGPEFDALAIHSPFDRTYFFQLPDTVVRLGAKRDGQQ